MTPKEKAKELLVGIYRFTNLTPDECKKSAIFSINEIAKCTKHFSKQFENDRFSEEYWDEVKIEILKLKP
jgi:hypothetical protein